MKREKLERAISICDKNIATAEEIIEGCGGVARAVFGKKGEEAVKGYVSCSLTSENLLTLCLWKRKPDGRYEKTEHLAVDKSGMLTLKGHIDLGIVQRVQRR